MLINNILMLSFIYIFFIFSVLFFSLSIISLLQFVLFTNYKCTFEHNMTPFKSFVWEPTKIRGFIPCHSSLSHFFMTSEIVFYA